MVAAAASPDENLAVRLRGHVHHLAATIGERNVYRPVALHEAADYIKQQWSAQGYRVESQAYTVQQVQSENLAVTCPGDQFPGQIILVGAHYDSVKGSPGANDNASGVAALLELSRLYSGKPGARTLRFVAFVNEEPPFFYSGQQGSQVYARDARRRGDDIRLMVSLETIGYYSRQPGSQIYPPLLGYFYPNRGDFIAFVSNLASRRRLHRLVRAFRQSSRFPAESLAAFSWIPGVAWSDHLAFWRNGYKAAMVTDTAFYRYPYYHLPQDTPEKLDYGSLAAVTRGLEGALGRLIDGG